MGDSADDVATTALVVAIIALFIALLQLTQQIFGTAEGYRQCQDSVIGPWARLTRLSWRWQGFRYETKFTIPLVGFKRLDLFKEPGTTGPYPLYIMHTYKPTQLSRTSHLRHWILQNLKPKTERYSSETIKRILWDSLEPSSHKDAFTADYVTWMPLLRALAHKEKTLKSVTRFELVFSDKRRRSRVDSLETVPPMATYAYVHLAERSWDLMPPDAVRPFAQTTLGDLITIVSRLGMTWQVFEPNQGILNAQGKDSSLTAVDVRGLGTLCQFRFDALPNPDSIVSESLVGGCVESDAFLCGTVPSGFVGIDWIPLVGQGNNKKPMNEFLELFSLIEVFQDDSGGKGNPQHSTEGEYHSRKHSTQKDKVSLVVCEAIGIIAPFMPLPGSIGSLVTWPIEQGTSAASMSWEGRAAFLHHCRGEHEWTSECLFLLEVEGVTNSRYDLCKSVLDWHLGMAARSLDGIDEGRNKNYPWVGPHERHGNKAENWKVALGQRYLEKHEEAVREKKDLFPDETAGDLWWLMMYRSICWYLCVDIDYNQTIVPSVYLGSKMPIYIG